VIAAPLAALIATGFGWRWMFFVTGALGIMWAVIWLRCYRPGSPEALKVEGDAPRVSWTELLRYRQVWGLIVAKFLTDSAWFFFIFWLPKYLNSERGLNIKQIGYYGCIPYALAGAGSFVGGWLSGALLAREFTLDTARKIALGVSAALVPAAVLIVPSPLSLTILFYSVAMFAHQFWSTIMQTLAADLFPPRMVGSVAGLMGGAGAVGAAIFSFVAGGIVGKYGYAPVFFATGVVHPISFLVVLLIVRRIERIAAV